MQSEDLPRAAGWRATACRLFGSNEGAHKLAVNLLDNRVSIEAGRGQEFTGILAVVHAGDFDIDPGESSRGELVHIVGFGQGTGDTTDPELHAPANSGRYFTAHDHIGDGEATAGPQHPERLPEYLVLVAREVDDAVRDDHVDGVARQRDVLDLAFQ